MTEFHFTAGDVEAASAVLLVTAEALIERGQPLWPLASLTPQRLLRHYPLESWRVAWHGEQPVAAYSLLPSDPLFWPDDAPGEALYLHKLGVVPQCQGQGLAQGMLRRAVERLAAERAEVTEPPDYTETLGELQRGVNTAAESSTSTCTSG